MAAFELNLAASQRGVFPRGLGDLRFTHAPWVGESARELRNALVSPPGPPARLGRRPTRAELVELAVAVNRAFLGGHDAGVLAQWVTTPLCGASSRSGRPLEVEGPASARCGFLDSACARAEYREASGCCSARQLPAGTMCGSGRLCAADGRCLPEASVPLADRIAGPARWVELLDESGYPFTWDLSALSGASTRISVVPDEEVSAIPDPPPPGSGPGGFEPSWGGSLGEPLGEVDTSVVATRRSCVGRSDPALVSGVAVDLDGGASALFVRGAPSEVCVVQGRRVDEVGPVLSDCSTGGAARVACPGTSGALSCAVEDGYSVVRGTGLTMAFEPATIGVDDLYDVTPISFHDRICLDPSCDLRNLGPAAVPPESLRGSIFFPLMFVAQPPAPCTLDGCVGRQLCIGPATVGPVRCFCATVFEQCDGNDNDCDGAVDEGASVYCDDAIGCTSDICADGACTTRTDNFNNASCSPAYCAKGVCDGNVPPIYAELPLTPRDDNGCQLALDHDFCEGRDRCACNGLSACDPANASSPAILGCNHNATAPSAYPCEAAGDGDLCTTEVCCEPNSDCRLLDGGTGAVPGLVLIGDTGQCVDEATFGAPNPAGGQLRCLSYDVLSRSDRERIHCNDANPCTLDRCASSATGACSSTPGVDGERPPTRVTASFLGVELYGLDLDPGCRVGGGGCVSNECRAGTCVPISTVPEGGTTPDCGSGDDPSTCGCNGVRDQCFATACDGAGSCRTTADDSLCGEDDGLVCTVPICTTFPCPPDDVCDPFPPAGCVELLVGGSCLIEGQCWDDGMLNPNNQPCEWCDATANRFDWSPRPGAPPEDCGPG